MKRVCFWIIIVLQVTFSIVVTGESDWSDSHEDNIAHPDGTYSAHCTSYCDVNGYYRPPKICFSSLTPVFCCGDETSRYCCRNASYSVGDRYPDVTSCYNSSWWLYHWRMIIGVLGSLLAVLMVAACCYSCCLTTCRDKRLLRRARRQQIPAVSADVEPEERPRLQPMFDPQSPYAFTPPDYNSLPSKPPAYAEAIRGFANNGFEGDENAAAAAAQQSHFDEPPPSYDAPSSAPTIQPQPPGGNGETVLPGAQQDSTNA